MGKRSLQKRHWEEGVGKSQVTTLKNCSENEDDQSWFWTDEWQRRIAEAMNDLKEGRVREFDSVEELIAELNGEPAD